MAASFIFGKLVRRNLIVPGIPWRRESVFIFKIIARVSKEVWAAITNITFKVQMTRK